MQKILVWAAFFTIFINCAVEVGAKGKGGHDAKDPSSPPVLKLSRDSSVDHNSSFPAVRATCYCEERTFSGFDKGIRTKDNVGCIGGCGGGPFSYPREIASTITRLKVWSGCGSPYNGFKGIQVTYGTSTFQFGGTCGEGKEITFSNGEHIVGDITISGNGHGSRVGYLKFKTTLQNFEFGDSGHDHYVFPADGSFLTGIYGRSGADLDLLGFIITEPIATTSLKNLRYPNLGSLTTGLQPKSIYTNTIYNDSPSEYRETIEAEEVRGEDRCWSTTLGAMFGMETSVTAGIPMVGSVTGGYRWEVSAQLQSDQCVRTSNTHLIRQEYIVEGYYECAITITQWASPVNALLYEGDFVFVMKSGVEFSRPTSGYYNGIYITAANKSIKCLPIGEAYEKAFKLYGLDYPKEHKERHLRQKDEL